jgi:hypothetical protein
MEKIHSYSSRGNARLNNGGLEEGRSISVPKPIVVIAIVFLITLFVSIIIQQSSFNASATENAYVWWFIITTGAIAILLTIIMLDRMAKKPFIIQDILLIRNNGILIARTSGIEEMKVDEDIFSGMLTVILNFIEDSLRFDDNEMKRFEFKDYSIAIQRGNHSLIALVYSGSPPENLESIMMNFMGRIEKIYGKRIEKYTGTVAADLAGIDIVFKTFIFDHSKGRKKQSGLK